MRVLVFIGAIVVLSVLTLGGGLLLVLQAGVDDGGWIWLATTATIGYMFAPLTLGSALAYWDLTRSEKLRRRHRLMVITTVGVEVVATALLCAYVMLSRAPFWVVPVYAGGSVVLTVVAALLGPAVRRREAPVRPRSEGPAYTRAELRGDLRRIIATGLIALLVLSAGFTALEFALSDGAGADSTIEVAAYSVLLSLMACAFVATLVWARSGRHQRDLVDRDLERMRNITKVVTQGKDVALSDDDVAVASRFAALSTVTISYQIVQVGLTLAALGGMQAIRLVNDPEDIFSLVLTGVFVVIFIAVVPIIVIQLRRTRRYAIEHGETILEPRESTTAPA